MRPSCPSGPFPSLPRPSSGSFPILPARSSGPFPSLLGKARMGLIALTLVCLAIACNSQTDAPAAPPALTPSPATPSPSPPASTATPQTPVPTPTPTTPPPASPTSLSTTSTPEAEPVAATPSPAPETPQPTAMSTPTQTPEVATETPTLAPETPNPTASPTPTTTPLPTATASPAGLPIGTVVIANTQFSVEVAANSDSRSTGLSYRDSLQPKAGMLFLMPREGAQTFWMKEMRFPLDIVWIGADCRVTGVTPDIPFPTPGTASSDLPRYKSPDGTLYVLEINAGLAAELGITEGTKATFINIDDAPPNTCAQATEDQTS